MHDEGHAREMIRFRNAAVDCAETNWYAWKHLCVHKCPVFQIIEPKIVRPEQCYQTLPLYADIVSRQPHQAVN